MIPNNDPAIPDSDPAIHLGMIVAHRPVDNWGNAGSFLGITRARHTATVPTSESRGHNGAGHDHGRAG